MVSGLALAVVAVGAYGVRRLRLFDTETPDAPADAAECYRTCAGSTICSRSSEAYARPARRSARRRPGPAAAR
ncbi:hypothetical protein [Micromonospora sp. b486]|uniref:hypothetical protein n=1 Tax=Micromonospora sp. b486 TaxID=3053986 RepID=UPI00259C8362|nr:hypothetical protein [Micromonospora sp. b486]MDM4784700.1 hypothetical protein [Micromonospora sp. b486]